MDYGISGMPILSILFVVGAFGLLFGYLVFVYKNEEEGIHDQLKGKKEQLGEKKSERQRLIDMGLLVESINFSSSNVHKIESKKAVIEGEIHQLELEINNLKQEKSKKSSVLKRIEMLAKWSLRGIFCVFLFLTFWKLVSYFA